MTKTNENLDINALTVDDVEDMLNLIGIQSDGDIDEKILEEKN